MVFLSAQNTFLIDASLNQVISLKPTEKGIWVSQNTSALAENPILFFYSKPKSKAWKKVFPEGKPSVVFLVVQTKSLAVDLFLFLYKL